jgi:hypothetical protein
MELRTDILNFLDVSPCCTVNKNDISYESTATILNKEDENILTLTHKNIQGLDTE